VSGFGRGLDALYFDYRPVAAHGEGCSRRGSDVWEVTRHEWLGIASDRRELTLRYACRECGVVVFQAFENAEPSTDVTCASEAGYGSRPEKVLGAWLHPGPRIWPRDERGPAAYLVTAVSAAPRRPEDVLGKVAWGLGPRGGVRWSAGRGCTKHGSVVEGAGQQWASRRAAVAWVIEHSKGDR
jgi:hypothetical protein